jgi:hypothetical protein
MAATDKGSRGKWVFICIGFVCFLILVALVALIALPYFATKPLSRDQLKEFVATPPPPQSTATPSPAPSPEVKKH